MLNSAHIPDYGHLAAQLNYQYAAKQGYSFHVERSPTNFEIEHGLFDPDNEYTFVWSKPGLLRRHAAVYDYVLFLDSDAVVMDLTLSVPALFAAAGPECCMLLQEDCKALLANGKKQCWQEGTYNTGIVAVRCTPIAQAILATWQQAALNECQTWQHKHTREQACLNFLRPSLPPGALEFLPFDVFGNPEGMGIRHFAGTSATARKRIFAKLLQDRGLIAQKTPSYAPWGILLGLLSGLALLCLLVLNR